jgi:hypothetical protein
MDQLPNFIAGGAASAVDGQLRPEERNDNDEEPYQSDLGAKIWSGTPDYGQKAPTTTTRELYTPAATPPSPLAGRAVGEEGERPQPNTRSTQESGEEREWEGGGGMSGSHALRSLRDT